MDITAGISGTPLRITQPRTIASLKGKEKVIDADERERDRLSEMWQKNQQEKMWREIWATQMTLGGTQMSATNICEKEKTTRALDFGSGDHAKEDPNENLHLTLASA